MEASTQRIVATKSLRELAEYFGVLEAVADQLRKYARDRIIWRERLRWIMR